MSRRPSTLFARVAALLAGTVGLCFVLSIVVIQITSDEGAGRVGIRGATARIVVADTLIASGKEAGLAEIHVIRAPAAPEGREPVLPIVRRTMNDIRQAFPGREVRLDGMRDATLWIVAPAPATGWIGVPVTNTGKPAFRAGLLTIALGGLLILVVAGLYARSITAPLRRLADSATHLVNGSEPPSLPGGAARELTELRSALARAAAHVRASASERDLMLAALSHDMRTPLARLRLGLELSPVSDPALRSGMEADIDALDSLCEHFIAFARDGRDEAMADVDLSSIVQDVVAVAAAHSEPWKVDAPQALGIHGKPMTLRRAVENLVGNASRHGAAPFEATIEVTDTAILATVSDHGPGVPEALLQHLGQPFFRGNAARSDATGSGLGLASVRRTAIQHGGELRLRNLPEGGFAATLVLPRGDLRTQGKA
jgi:two-component system osmolarity sensor histidine kinase EnvZ